MSTNLYKCLKNHAALSPTELHQANQKYRLQLASAEWFLCVSLLASEREKLYRQLEEKHPDIISYAERELELSRQKTVELLSTARAMERLPLLSDAFRKGRLSWAKVRELKRVATPETERVWIDFALKHNVSAIQKRVAMSPTEWKRGRALAASTQGRPTATTADVEQVLDQPLLGPVSEEETPPEPALPAPRLIKVVHYLTPDEYAIYKEAEDRARSRRNKRIKREAVLMEWANSELSGGTAKARARHQVLIHTTPDSDHAWYETDRGWLTADPELVEETKKQGREINLEPPRETSPGKCIAGHPKRRPIPNAVLRFIFARAGNRCECCGRKGCQLDAHHKRAVSDGGGDRPQDLLVLCKVCHALTHEQDFEHRLDWIRARARALMRGEPTIPI